MKREDIERFSSSYGEEEAAWPETNLAAALGLELNEVAQLARDIRTDLDPSIGGVGWMDTAGDVTRRILISDHLLQCVTSIVTNLVEARLHLIEWRDFHDQEHRFMQDAVRAGPGGPEIDPPARTKPLDDIPNAMMSLHAAGLFRAVGSAADCLGGAVIAILGLPLSLIRADLDRTSSPMFTPTHASRLNRPLRCPLRRHAAAPTPPPEWRHGP